MVGSTSYGAVVLPLKHPLELERSQCPSPSSSLDTNPLIWETADRLVLSLLLQANSPMEDEDEDDDLFLETPLHLPKPIPVHPAHVALVTPAARNSSDLARPHSAMW